MIEQFEIRAEPTTAVGTLSGGNIQKVLLARALHRRPKILLAAQPTRGLDIGTFRYVHQRLAELRDSRRRRPGHLRGPRRAARAGRPDPGGLPRRDRRRAAGGRGHQRAPRRPHDRTGRRLMPARSSFSLPRFVLRGHQPRWLTPVAMASAVVFTVLLTAIPIRLAGANPPATFERYLVRPLSTADGRLRGAAHRHPADVHRPGGRDRLPGRLLEHRRRGPVPGRRGLRDLGRYDVRRAPRPGGHPPGLRSPGPSAVSRGPPSRPGSSGRPGSTRWSRPCCSTRSRCSSCRGCSTARGATPRPGSPTPTGSARATTCRCSSREAARTWA